MKKKVIEVELDYPLNWTDGIEIERLKKDIEELEKLGATHLNIEPGSSFDCSYVDIIAVCQRLETDQEFKERKKQIQSEKDMIKKRELKQLADLKAKYEC